MTFPAGISPISSMTRQVADGAAGPSDVRTGRVVAVTARGIDVEVAGGLVEGAAHLSSYNPAVGDAVALIRFRDSWLVLDRPVGPGTAADFATPGSGVGTTLLGGMALSGTGATMASSTGALVTIPRYGITIHHPLNHWVMIMAGFHWYSSVTNDWLTISIANASFGSVVVGGNDFIQAGNNFFAHFSTVCALIPPDPFGGQGSSYFTQLQRVNGAGTSRVDDIAARRGYMLAFDMGDVSVIGTV